jgi:hypothetical protein
MPYARSIVSTFSPVCDQKISGTYRSFEFSKLRRSRLALAPSFCRFNSLCRVLATSLNMSRGRILSACGCQRSTMPANASSNSRLRAMFLATFGRSTLTTTSRARAGGATAVESKFSGPALDGTSFARLDMGSKRAACTCATDAEASGTSSKLAYNSPIGLPSDSSTIFRATSPGNGGT